MSQFVEASVLVYSQREEKEHVEKRVINVNCIRCITAYPGGKAQIFFRGKTSPLAWTTAEPYEYWMLVLTSSQPREAVA